MSKSLTYEVINNLFILKDVLNSTLTYKNIKGIEQDSKKIIDYTSLPLTLICTKSGTIDFSNSGKRNLYFSNDGENWLIPASDLPIATLSVGDKIMFGGNVIPRSNENPNSSNCGPGHFSGTAEFEAIGNPLSILDFTSFAELKDISSIDFALAYLFYGSNIVSAKNLVLPATKLGEQAYRGMFSTCTKLVTPPLLFATLLADNCYDSMFWKCTAMTTAPELKATTLSDNCYNAMFGYCSSLRKAPNLIAKTLKPGCYYNMFAYCSNLNYVKVLFDEIPSIDDELLEISYFTAAWLTDVATTGKLVLSIYALWRPEGNNDSILPETWTWEFEDGSKDISYNGVLLESQLFNWSKVLDTCIVKDRTWFYSEEEDESWHEPGGFPDPPPHRSITITVGSSSCTLHMDGTTAIHYYMNGAISTTTEFISDWEIFMSEISPLVKEFIMRGISTNLSPSVSGDNEYATDTFGERLRFRYKT